MSIETKDGSKIAPWLDTGSFCGVWHYFDLLNRRRLLLNVFPFRSRNQDIGIESFLVFHRMRAHLMFFVDTNLTVCSLVHKELIFLEFLGYLLRFMRLRLFCILLFFNSVRQQ